MFRVPDETVRYFDATMEAAGVVKEKRWCCQNWIRYYLDCAARMLRGTPLAFLLLSSHLG